MWLFLCCISTSLLAIDPSNSAEDPLDSLIETTERSLHSLKEIQQALSAFKAQEAVCVEQADNLQALYLLSQRANLVLQQIQAAKLEVYFQPHFLEELAIIAKPSAQNSIPPISHQ